MVKSMSFPAHSSDLIVTRRSDVYFLLSYLKAIEKWTDSESIFQHLLSFKWYYKDLADSGTHVQKLILKWKFEDSWEWNRAVTASIIKYNIIKGNSVWISDPEVLNDAKLAGLSGYSLIPCGFVLKIVREGLLNSKKCRQYFHVPEYMDPLSRNQLAKQFYIAGIYFRMSGENDRAEHMFNISKDLLKRLSGRCLGKRN